MKMLYKIKMTNDVNWREISVPDKIVLPWSYIKAIMMETISKEEAGVYYYFEVKEYFDGEYVESYTCKWQHFTDGFIKLMSVKTESCP